MLPDEHSACVQVEGDGRGCSGGMWQASGRRIQLRIQLRHQVARQSIKVAQHVVHELEEAEEGDARGIGRAALARGHNRACGSRRLREEVAARALAQRVPEQQEELHVCERQQLEGARAALLLGFLRGSAQLVERPTKHVAHERIVGGCGRCLAGLGRLAGERERARMLAGGT